MAIQPQKVDLQEKGLYISLTLKWLNDSFDLKHGSVTIEKESAIMVRYGTAALNN